MEDTLRTLVWKGQRCQNSTWKMVDQLPACRRAGSGESRVGGFDYMECEGKMTLRQDYSHQCSRGAGAAGELEGGQRPKPTRPPRISTDQDYMDQDYTA